MPHKISIKNFMKKLGDDVSKFLVSAVGGGSSLGVSAYYFYKNPPAIYGKDNGGFYISSYQPLSLEGYAFGLETSLAGVIASYNTIYGSGKIKKASPIIHLGSIIASFFLPSLDLIYHQDNVYTFKRNYKTQALVATTDLLLQYYLLDYKKINGFVKGHFNNFVNKIKNKIAKFIESYSKQTIIIKNEIKRTPLNSDLNKTKICPECGYEEDIIAKYCSRCGYHYAENKDISPKVDNPSFLSKVVCPQCGNKVNKNTKTCPFCRYDFF